MARLGGLEALGWVRGVAIEGRPGWAVGSSRSGGGLRETCLPFRALETPTRLSGGSGIRAAWRRGRGGGRSSALAVLRSRCLCVLLSALFSAVLIPSERWEEKLTEKRRESLGRGATLRIAPPLAGMAGVVALFLLFSRPLSLLAAWWSGRSTRLLGERVAPDDQMLDARMGFRGGIPRGRRE